MKKQFLFFALSLFLEQMAWAQKTPVKYMDRSWNPDVKQVVSIEREVTDYFYVSSMDDASDQTDTYRFNFYDKAHGGPSDYYVVNEDFTFENHAPKVFGEVHLILVDDKTLTLKRGMRVNAVDGSVLHIYGQAGDSGTLEAAPTQSGDVGIGSDKGYDAGDIIILGGRITAKGCTGAAAIGGGENGKCGNVVIYGGNVIAEGGLLAAGIGGGENRGIADDKSVTIYGGYVNAQGGLYNPGNILSFGGGAGIGGGDDASQGGAVYIHGGEITAYACKFTEPNETYSKCYGAGIGGGDQGNGGKVVITGGTVKASGTIGHGAGIGGGQDGEGGDVTISGGKVIATAGMKCTPIASDGGSAIGCGNETSGKGSKSTLTFGPAMKVTAGNSEADNDGTSLADERKNACAWRACVVIETCEHADGVTYTPAMTGHTVNCKYCGIASQDDEPHNMVDHECTLCGYVEDDHAYAIWCADDNTLYFNVSNDTYKEGDTYNGSTITNVWKDAAVTESGDYPGWRSITTAQLKKVVFEDRFAMARPTSCSNWFAYFHEIAAIEGLENLNTSEVTDMKEMFRGCSSLTSLDLSAFNTSKVTNMNNMFFRCEGLTALDLHSFNTSAVTNMEDMFKECVGLKELDLRTFDTQHVENMKGMFGYCKALADIWVKDLWSTAAVTISEGMFTDCGALVGGRGTVYGVANVDATYAHVDEGTANPGYFRSTVPTPYAIFSADEGVLTFGYGPLPKTGENYNGNVVSKVWSGEQVTNYGGRPGWVASLGNYDVKKAVFESSFTSVRPKTLEEFFFYCMGMTSIEGLENLRTSEVTTMHNMFHSCEQLESINLTNFDTRQVANLSGMFDRCSKITELDLSNFYTYNVTDMPGMFANCGNLVQVAVSSGWTVENVDNSEDMFAECKKIRGGEGTAYNPNRTDKEYARIDGGAFAPGYFSSELTPIPTAIDNANFNDNINFNDDAIYDLMGRKIEDGKLSNCKLPKGIYIVSGKKMVVK